MNEEWILVEEDGTIRFVHQDDLAIALEDIGGMSTKRASNVEPHPTKQGWLADMRPSGGPILGFGSALSVDAAQASAEAKSIAALTSLLQPFKTRTEALKAERDWLRIHKGL